METKDIHAQRRVKRSEQVQDLLLHVGWDEVVKPELDKLVEQLQVCLVKSVLGQKITSVTATGGVIEFTKEQLAGQLEGLAIIDNIIIGIIKDGERGLEYLRNYTDNFAVQ